MHSYFALLICLASALALCGCHAPQGSGPAAAMVVALPVHPAAGDGLVPMSYPTEAAARYSTPMSFRVDGKIVERYVHLGEAVRKGQRVAALEASDARAKAEADHAALQAAIHRLEFAKQTLDRDTAQFAQHLIAQSALELSQDNYAAALAARAEAAQQYAVSRDNLDYQWLTADHDGVIVGERADTGQVVSRGQVVFELAWAGDVDAILDASANDVGRITAGQAASVSFTALPGRHFDATVREISAAADPQSRTYRVKLTLAKATPEVRLGMTGEAMFAAPPVAGAAGPVFRIPSTAIFHQGNEPAVWVIRPADSKLELRPVAVHSYLDGAAVVSGRIADGDELVLAGVHTVYAGERVTPVKPLYSDDAHE
jgi:RND family efflux transporter MFP subunit